MPTQEQLFSIWETQFEFFGGFGQPKANYVGNSEGPSEGNGLTSQRLANTPLVPHPIFKGFTGEEIGELKFNSETGDLKILINQK